MREHRSNAALESLEPRLFLSAETLAAPTLPDQVISHTQGELVVSLPVTDAQGDLLSYSASIRTPAAEAYALKQRLDLSTYAQQFDNWSGRGEKWFQDGRSGWHYLLGDGRMFQWNTGALEGQIDTAYYADPQALLGVQDSRQSPVAVEVSGNHLKILPPADFVGKFLVDVTAIDGAAQATGSFSVTVTNYAPVLAVADVTISHTQDQIVLNLPSTDADGDIITYTAAVKSGDAAAYALKQRLGLATYAPQYNNWSGRGEKWLQNSQGGWFYLTSDGNLYNYAGGKLEGRVDAGYYANPLTLINLEAPQPVSIPLTVAGNIITLDPPDNFMGKFNVDVTASDGITRVVGAFAVNVTNAAPVLSLTDQTMPATQDKLVLTLPATDADGDAVTYTASVTMPATQAYDLKQRLSLSSYAPQYDNCIGRGEKWFLNSSSNWFYMLADGKVYQYVSNTLQGQVDTSYYANPAQLITVQPVVQGDVAVSVLGNQVTLDPASGFYGQFQVQVTASDGVAAPVTARFNVTVLPLNDPATYTAGATVVTRTVPLASGLEFVVLGTDQADTLVVSQTADKVTLTTSAGSTDYAGRFTAVTLYGFGGDDTIRTTLSVTATVTVHGGSGADSIYVAGTGTAAAYGDAGDDLIVTVGGGTATASGGDGLDSFWVDSADRVADTSAAETAAASVHSITQFYQPKNAANQAVPLNIDGQDLVDPKADYVYRTFPSTPLFVDGPEYTDLRQGAMGDCYFMAALASLAQTDPMAVRQMIAPMGDGTFAVRFYNGSGQANYMRVDGTLPAYGMTPAYAKLSPEGEFWAALAEKAYAEFRTGANTYASLNAGWMDPVYQAVTNAATNTVYTTIGSLATTMSDLLAAGHAVTAASVAQPVGPAVGGHAYMVKTVETVGGDSYVTVYNPWGYDGVSWDSNASDGLLKMTLSTFKQNFFAVSYCMA